MVFIGYFKSFNTYKIFVSYTLDLDECSLGTSKCDKICKNTIGSYECDCYDGYQLSNDAYTCEGMSICNRI